MKKHVIKGILSRRRDIKNLTDVRTVIMIHNEFSNVKIIGKIRLLSKVYESNYSWQERRRWIRNVVNYKGPLGENLEWLTISNHSKEIAQKKMQIKAERVTGKKNPGFAHGGRLSPFSTKFKNYSEEKRLTLIDNVKQIKKNNPYMNNTNIEYWTRQGYSKEVAKDLLSKRQATFSLEKCIKRHGEENGKIIFTNRQVKWQSTLNSKSPEEKLLTNKKRTWKSGNRSKAEMIIFEKLLELGYNAEYRFHLSDDRNYYYDIRVENKIIEYNGDYWHANPSKYKSTDIIKFPGKSKLAGDVWKIDEQKIKIARNSGFEVLTIWESEYNHNKTEIINKCLTFLNK